MSHLHNMGSSLQIKLSLFDIVRGLLGNTVPIASVSKTTLVYLSHSLEDIVIQNNLEALILTGFQETSYWREETERYQRLAGIAKQVYIFAGKPLPEDQASKVIQVQLRGDDPLRQEWFVLIYSADFPVLLCGKDRMINAADEGLREFETILSFSPQVIEFVLDQMSDILQAYMPEKANSLREARRLLPPLQPDIHLLNRFVADMMQFEEILVQNLYKANADLRNQRDFNAMLIEESPAFFVTTDNTGHIIQVNPVLSEKLGRPEQELIGAHILDVIAPDGERQLYQESMQRITSSRNALSFRTCIRNMTGTTRVEWHINGLYNPVEGAHIMWMGIDITDRERAEALQRQEMELRLHLEKERSLSAMRHQFITTVSHEFRTPLSIILTSTEMMDHYYDRLNTEDRHKRLTRIRHQVDHMTRMVEDITILNALHDDSFVLKPQPLDLITFLQNLSRDTEQHLQAPGRIHFTGHWQRESIHADSRLLSHIVLNLLSNALQYSPPDSPVKLSLSDTGAYFHIEVIDHGIGIPQSEQKQIYDAFFRGSNVHNTTGIGLGLVIVSDSIRHYNGHIEYQSVEGEGTRFRVTLPVL